MKAMLNSMEAIIVFVVLSVALVYCMMALGRRVDEVPCEAEPRVVISPAKKFAQQIKFAVRLRRQMRRFKEKKEAQKSGE